MEAIPGNVCSREEVISAPGTASNTDDGLRGNPWNESP
jgi:hypothetical protein